MRDLGRYGRLHAAVAAALIAGAPVVAQAQQQGIDIPAGSLAASLAELGRQGQVQIVAASDLVAGRQAGAVAGAADVRVALAQMLAGSGILWQQSGPQTFTLSAPQAVPAAEGALVLDPVQLTAETAFGAVFGYRAGASATATRTDTPLRDIPQTVDVIGREEIEDRQVTSLTDAVEAAPNVQQNSTSGNRGETFILRGFPTSSYAIDGTPLSAAGDRPEVLLDLAGVERVEVLKGPASVLYGLGEPGGVINVVTRRPSAVTGGDAALQWGSYGFARSEASVTGALNDSGTLTGRLTGAAQREGSWQAGRPDSERQYLGGVLEWQATPDTRLSFSLDHTRTKQPFDRGLIVRDDTNEVMEPYDSFLGEDWSMVEAEKTRAAFDLEHVAAPNLTLRAHLAYDEALVNDTGIDYRSLAADGRTLGRRYTDRTEDSSNLDLRLEALLKLSTGAVDHDLLAGLQFTEARMDFRNARANIDAIDIFDPVHGAAMPAASPNSAYDGVVRARSVYLQDQISFSPRWKALAGLRWDDYDLRRDVELGDAVAPNAQSALTGRLGLVWQPRTDLALYANWAESFQPQDGVDQAGDALDAEEGEQYEIGAKWDLVPGRLSATLAAFQITKSNVATDDPDNPGADYQLVTGEQRVRGIEAELSGEVLPGWKLHGGLGLLDAKITRDETYEVGNRLPAVPEYSARLWSTYEFDEGRARGLTLGGGVTYVGAREGDLENSYDVDGYARLDAMASYAFRNGAALSVTLRNVTDAEYIATPVGRTENYAGAPRTLIAKLDWSF